MEGSPLRGGRFLAHCPLLTSLFLGVHCTSGPVATSFAQRRVRQNPGGSKVMLSSLHLPPHPHNDSLCQTESGKSKMAPCGQQAICLRQTLSQSKVISNKSRMYSVPQIPHLKIR